MSSIREASGRCTRTLKSLSTASVPRAVGLAMTIAVVIAFCLCSAKAALAITYTQVGCPSGSLLPGGSATTDLKIDNACTVTGDARRVGVYVYHNVNIVAGGTLSFEDTRIDFHAESIIVENGGTIKAGTVEHPIGRNPGIANEMGARVRIYLWGASGDPGALCEQENCGVPSGLWSQNTTLMTHTVPSPKNGSCVTASSINPLYKLPGDDCFYPYDSFDTADSGKAAYFGHKVLAISYGGTIQFLGVKGATYSTQVDNDPSQTGQSWVRLAGISSDMKTLTLSAAVPTWRMGDHIVVTTTDYLPTHNEEAVIQSLSPDNTMVTLQSALQNKHNANAYTLPSNTPASIGPRPIASNNPPSVSSPDTPRTVETRAAVGLLTRSIEILSDPDTPDTDITEHDHFPPSKGYFGGHTVARQGFAKYQVKGVEFYHLGQGGVIGHYPVHFHMDRKTSDDTTLAADAPYIRDSSIHDSMTRWITVHATQGMTVQRNVGYQSIGHGFYLEDATEINNKIYGNLGASVIAAVQSPTLNPRNTPGILFRPGDGPVADPFPYRSDWDHPSAFWIMNGWNDFQYNMAAGVTSCGSCYWLVPGADGGPSMFEVWDGYASQQLDPNNPGTNNIGRAGLAPLKNFVGNSCVSAQFSFVTVGTTYPCLGFSDGVVAGQTTLVAVPNTLAPATGTDAAAIYYPQATGLRNPSQCTGTGDCSTQAPCANSGPDAGKNCMVTVLNRYDTSFNYAQTNFAAIWMRAKWFLFTDGAVTDSQYAGLNFTTGGGYTRSDNPYGNWMLAYRSVFIGSSQPIGSNGMPANAYASDAGPFNPTTGLTCSNSTNYGFCLSSANAISFQMGPFPGQRMFSVYDGPAFQESNAYLDTYPTLLTGAPDGWMYLNRYPNGIPKDSSGQCYLPNAAIAWKQPNGFYYPPAFHSQNLMFANTKPAPGLIRHFLIEPTFPILTKPGLHQPNTSITTNYCPRTDSPGMFNNFTDIDRQTVLNDGVPDMGIIPGGDGSLTGLIATQKTLPATTGRETISVNEDPFFNAPVEHTECASDKHPSSADGKGKPGTAKTSPYEYVTTGIIPECAIGYYTETLPCPPPDQNKQCPVPKECNQGGVYTGVSYWTHVNANPDSFGVPLYREYLTTAEFSKTPKPKPFIQMMGQSTGQRSTLTINHGRFYMDTSNNCTVQNPGGNPPGSGNPPGCLPYQLPNGKPQVDVGVSVFEPGQTYYVYFIYGRASTYLTFDIYLGPNDETGKWAVSPIKGVFDGEPYEFCTVGSGPPCNMTGEQPWLLTPTYDRAKNVLTVTVDLSKSTIVQDFSSELAKSCQPLTYCAVTNNVCGCKPGTNCKEEKVGNQIVGPCTWGPKDPDCPDTGCYGFSFTMPSDWPGPPAQHVDPPDGVLFSTGDPYFTLDYNDSGKPNVNFGAVNPGKFGQGSQCDYRMP